MSDAEIRPFEVSVDTDAVADLRRRLVDARLPDQLPDAGWEYGTERDFLRSVCAYWRETFDWDRFAARLNGFDQYTTTIDGQRVHFYHVESPEADAEPLLLSHGWPGSVAEFLDVLGPLTDPAAHGGDPGDAFDVVAPSIPGYGFSGPTTERGYDVQRVAATFDALMARLGYDDYFAQGGDWGALVTALLGAHHDARAIHTNMLFVAPSKFDVEDPMALLDEEGRADVAASRERRDGEMAYFDLQSTKPQSLGYGLNDSPTGLAAWILEKFRTWSDTDDLLERFGHDRLLDNVSIYWLTETITSSMRLYYETDSREAIPASVDVPTGHARYPAEITRTPRVWAEQTYDVVHWTEMPEGGHFAAMEVPELFVEDVRAFFRTVR